MSAANRRRSPKTSCCCCIYTSLVFFSIFHLFHVSRDYISVSTFPDFQTSFSSSSFLTEDWSVKSRVHQIRGGVHLRQAGKLQNFSQNRTFELEPTPVFLSQLVKTLLQVITMISFVRRFSRNRALLKKNTSPLLFSSVHFGLYL